MPAKDPNRNASQSHSDSAPSAETANALIKEKSPYLLQHAHNPVDWLPWGDKAFERARQEDKPIFLSIGYSTCHWCHVMERESFESQEIAEVLNENFVSVKVDREERPDVDSTYMTYVQMRNNGQGGWPMSVWLTPELTPFFGGTYFPPDERYGRAGFKTILRQIADLWRTRRDSLLEEGRQVINAIQEHMDKAAREGTDNLPGGQALTEFVSQCQAAFDERHGGFNGAPKFPRPAVYRLLLHLAAPGNEQISEEDRQTARQIIGTSLDAMAAGGMYDQIGGGFHRYSVDARWHVPHFEKMLYDQGQLASIYIEAARVLDRPDFAEIAREVLDYVKRDLGQADGAFYSAEDADSKPAENSEHKMEGAFYVWKWAELRSLLDDEELPLAARVYGAGEAGNVNPESDPHGELEDQNVLYRQLTEEQVADLRDLSVDEVRKQLEGIRRKLFEAREKRPRPHRDDKVLTAWNALQIAALARAARRQQEPARAREARDAVKFLKKNLVDEQGRLLRTWREEPGSIPAFAADYAFLIDALIQLYQADFDVAHLQWAFELQDQMDELYFDEKAGGYLSTPRGREDSILSLKEVQDGAEPSPNSIAARNLLALAVYRGREEHRVRAEEILKSTVTTLQQHPYAVPEMGIALAQALQPPRQAVICRESAGHEHGQKLAAWLQQNAPEDVFLFSLSSPEDRKILAHEVFSSMKPGEKGAAVYICENLTCREPVDSVEGLEEYFKAAS